MSKVTLNKALKLKNRQVQKLGEIRKLVQTHNVRIAGGKPEFDTHALLQDYLNQSEKLWKLKATINAANAPVQDAIYEMAELKATIGWLRQLETKQGLQMQIYGQSAPVEYVAQIDAQTLGKKIEVLEARIDALQDELDRFNANTQIEIVD